MQKYLRKFFIDKQSMFFLLSFFVLLVFLVFVELSISNSFDVNLASVFFILIFIVWLVSFEVLNLLIENKRSFLYNSMLVVLIGAFFVRSLESLVAFLILAGGFYEAHRRFCKLKELFNKFDFVAILKDSIPVLMTTISLFVAIIFTSLSIDADSNNENPISRSMFDFVFVPIEDTFDIFTDNDIGNFILEKISITEESATEEEISIGDKFYNAINERIIVSTREIGYVALVVVVSLFLFFRIFSLIIMWVSFIATFVAIKALLFYNIISLNKKRATRESVKFK